MKSFRDYLEETIRRYGAVGHSPAMGNTLEEDDLDGNAYEMGYRAAALYHRSQSSNPFEGKDETKAMDWEDGWKQGASEENLDEGRMSDIDVERQDYENLDPLSFRNRYHMSKEEWYGQHKSLLEPKKQSQDNAHWDFGRMLELAGCKGVKEDQDAEVVAQKELDDRLDGDLAEAK